MTISLPCTACGRSLRTLSSAGVSRRFSLDPPAETGWLVIPEALHPDWKATQAGRVLQIAGAYGAFLAIRLDGTAGAILLSFHPPWWYFACVWTSLAGWLAVIALLSAKKSLASAGGLAERSCCTLPLPQKTSHPIRVIYASLLQGKVLVIIPTYNEASGIGSILDKTLIANPSLGNRCR